MGSGFVGYILTRLIGNKKGTFLSGLLGGLVSSTAVTQALSIRSTSEKKLLSTFVASTIAASSIMFVRAFVVVGVLKPDLLPLLMIPLGIMFGISLTQVVLYMLVFKKRKKDRSRKRSDVMAKSPFKLGPALQFGLFFVVVLYISKFAQDFLGTQGTYITAVLSGVVDIDAFTLSMIRLSNADAGIMVTAAKAIVVVIISNMFFKAGIAFLFGSRAFAWQIIKNFSIIALCGLVVLLFL